MLRGLYTAAGGMLAQQRKHDTVTNNIANVNTPGYKQSELVTRPFPEMLISLMGSGNGTSRSIGRLNTGVLPEETMAMFLQGDLAETGLASDFAIYSNLQTEPPMAFDASGKAVTADGQVVFRPQAFFTVQGAGGERLYTRNGKFTLDAQGNLVTANGDKVVGTNGQPILLANTDISELKVTQTGLLTEGGTGMPVLDANGAPVSLLISRIERPHKLVLEGNGNYRLDDPQNPAKAIDFTDSADPSRTGVQVRQGFIERSNVNASQSMVDMMSALRAYEANQKVIQFYDKSLDKAVNEVGRV